MELRNEDDPTFIKLQAASSDLKTLLKASVNMDASYEKMDEKFEAIEESLNMASKRVAPLQSLSIANKALDTRINRAISPALALLDSFKLFESLQRKLLEIASKLLSEKKSRKRLRKLIKYVDCVDKLTEAINSISQESEPAIQKLQEVVEFLSRTKATDHYRTERLRETLITLKAICETEVDSMRFDGLLDEALLNLQDEYEGLLQKLRHQSIGDQGQGDEKSKVEVNDGLGSDLEVEVLRRICETLAANDCLDICIDMLVKVRYRRAAKALMRLSPDYLKTYTPEEIDEMEWESLETAIALWIQHFELAVKAVLVSEKNLCNQVLGNIMEGMVWPECFIKIADKIMAVFFRFGEGVARSNREPQKLFKLLDMFDSLEKLKPEFSEIFDGEAGADICSRFRELEKLLVHVSTRVFWEFGLQIEGNQDGLPPPQDGSVPKLVRYAINYLKNLTVDSYSAPMAQVLRTEQLWKAGILSNPENDQDLLKDAISNVMEAIQRNIESKKSSYKDKVLSQIFAMNTYWYIYMRTKNMELGKLLGEPYMKKRYRHAAEESAYMYQKQAWGTLVGLLDKEEIRRVNNQEGLGGVVRGKMESFMVGFDEMCQRHRTTYKIVSDADLREQMKDATVRLVVPAYTEFFNTYSSLLLQAKSYPPPESIEALLGQIFEGGDQGGTDGKPNLARRDSKDQMDRRMSVDRSRFNKDYLTV
ncbi:hypothetical protein Pfo_016808 [Paulownia fortunei]|nr:hypothetical protein Pfo_016808 [Paulownia fortunei]